MQHLAFKKSSSITYSYEDGGANDLPKAIMIRITSMMPDEDILEWLRGAGLEGFSTPEELDVDFFGFMFLIDYSMKDFLTGKADILFLTQQLNAYHYTIDKLKENPLLKVAVWFN